MTAISKFPEPQVVETSKAFHENSNQNTDIPSKRKWRCSNSDADDGEAEDSQNDAPNCSKYGESEFLSDLALRVSSPVPTCSNVPWSRSQEYPADIEGLHFELIECYEWLRPTEQERFARCNVCQRVRNVLASICPDAIFYVFGSVATFLYLPTSDIDISVDLPRLTPYDMQIVASAFRNSKNFKDVNVLDRAYVPIIKLTDIETRINIDISFNTSKAHSAVEYIMYMKFYYPSLELLTLFLKQFLAVRQLNQAFTGGLTSYGLVLMIIHYMLRCYRESLYMQTLDMLKSGILGDFIMGFLKFYGNDFDPMKDALAFPNYDEAALVSKVELTAMMHESLFASVLCVQDPLTPVNDVGRGAHNFMQVQASFLSAFTKLDERLSKKRIIKSGEPMLHSIMTFSSTFVQFRKRINRLPFENISQHEANQPYIFGGQPSLFSFGNEPRHAVLYPPINIRLSPRIFVPPMHHQQLQPSISTYDIENATEQRLSSSSSESSSATPTAFSSPCAGDIPRDNEYSVAPPLPQIFFPPPHSRQIYSYNPYFAPNFQIPQQFSPQLPYYFNGFNSLISSGYGYSESDSYCTEKQILSEDNFEKILSINDDESKCNGNNSDDSESSGLSSNSSDSMQHPMIE